MVLRIAHCSYTRPDDGRDDKLAGYSAEICGGAQYVRITEECRSFNDPSRTSASAENRLLKAVFLIDSYWHVTAVALR